MDAATKQDIAALVALLADAMGVVRYPRPVPFVPPPLPVDVEATLPLDVKVPPLPVSGEAPLLDPEPVESWAARHWLTPVHGGDPTA